MTKKSFIKLKKFLIENADSIQKLATKQHKKLLGGKKFRSEIIKKYQENHIKIIIQLARHLENEDVKKGVKVFQKLAKTLATDSVKDKLTIEEAVDGIAFLKQAIWKQLKQGGYLKNLSLDEFYNFSQRIGTYVDIVSSSLAFIYHERFKEQIEEDKQKLKHAEEIQKHFAAIVESSDDAIISKNVKGTITSWNRGAQRLYGYKAKEIIGQPVSTLMPIGKKDDFPKIMRMLRADKKVSHYETKRVKKDGTIIDVSITVSPIRDRNGKIIGASKIARDITKQKELDIQKEEFLGIASHELKTPVTSIKSFTQFLKLRFEKEGNKEAVDILGKLDRQVDKLRNLMGDLLDITKFNTGKAHFNEEYFYLDHLVTEIVEEVQYTTEKHKLIKKGITGNKVFGDRERISQVLTNLLSNAIKYSPSSTDIFIFSGVDNGFIKVCVQDYGIGIPQDKKEKVFERFFRASGPGKYTYPGLGLGLYISSEIVKRSGGRIWVESIEGKGSKFCFTLPIRKHTDRH